jgi:hypothetical protein
MNDQLQEQISGLADADLAKVEGIIKDVREARIKARNAALPDYVWVTALQGSRIQTTLNHALELIAKGGYDEVDVPEQQSPNDLVWVTKKQGSVFHVTRD